MTMIPELPVSELSDSFYNAALDSFPEETWLNSHDFICLFCSLPL